MSDLVGNPEDRFSRVAAQIINGVINFFSNITVPDSHRNQCKVLQTCRFNAYFMAIKIDFVH